jgi:hypothetical protein
MRGRIAGAVLVGLLAGGSAWGGLDGAALAEPPIPLPEPAGQELLFHSRARADFLPLAGWFVTQANLAYCGVASAVMALNSLGTPAPETPGYGSYRFWTQDNLFTAPAGRAFATAESVGRRGMTLVQLAGLLAAQGVSVQRWHGDQLSLPQFRGLLLRSLSDPDDRLLVNYLRPSLGQQGGGHISPLAAFDPAGDRVLILDVARYRYPSVWVATEALWRSIRTVDPDSGVSRGLVRISRGPVTATPAPPARPPSGP